MARQMLDRAAQHLFAGIPVGGGGSAGSPCCIWPCCNRSVCNCSVVGLSDCKTGADGPASVVLSVSGASGAIFWAVARLWRRLTSASTTAGEMLSRRTMARAWSMPCVRAMAISVSSSRQGEVLRKGAATAIGWQAMKKATAEGTCAERERAATAWRRASSLEALNRGAKSSANCRSSDFPGCSSSSKLVTVAIRTTSFLRIACGLSSSRYRSTDKSTNA